MNWPWDRKIDRNSLIETLNKVSKLIKFYEQYKFGWEYLIPTRVHEKILDAARAIKRGEDFQVYYAEMKDVYEAIQVLNQKDVANRPDVAAKAYGQLLKSLGTVIGALPPPASYYSQPLTLLGGQFQATVKVLMPSAHGSGLDGDLQDFLHGGQKFINGV